MIIFVRGGRGGCWSGGLVLGGCRLVSAERGGRNDRYFGLALAETVAQNTNPATGAGGWGGDFSSSPSATDPWFRRGGQSSNAATAGVFASTGNTGGANTSFGWRLGYGATQRTARPPPLVPPFAGLTPVAPKLRLRALVAVSTVDDQ